MLQTTIDVSFVILLLAATYYFIIHIEFIYTNSQLILNYLAKSFRNCRIRFLFAFLFFLSANNNFLSQKVNSTKSSHRDSVNVLISDTIAQEFYLKGGATITNKGISYIPVLSLGKPAVIFDLSMGTKKFLFEPQLRFALNTEPWSFQFPVRYKMKFTDRLRVTTGIIPLMNFKNTICNVNGNITNELVNRRYVGAEFRPTYFISERISLGAYWLYFRGISESTLVNTNFFAVTASFLNLKLFWKLIIKINAQVYYLIQDQFSGYFYNPVIILMKSKFPLSIQTIMNGTIKSSIPGSQKFIWNVGLTYAFNNTYTRKINIK
ncbi:MAG: hypothetical protein WC044_07940 [Crocinitomicaceae bacterium]